MLKAANTSITRQVSRTFDQDTISNYCSRSGGKWLNISKSKHRECQSRVRIRKIALNHRHKRSWVKHITMKITPIDLLLRISGDLGVYIHRISTNIGKVQRRLDRDCAGATWYTISYQGRNSKRKDPFTFKNNVFSFKIVDIRMWILEVSKIEKNEKKKKRFDRLRSPHKPALGSVLLRPSTASTGGKSVDPYV